MSAFLAGLWAISKRVPLQVWLELALVGCVWYWHVSAVDRAADEATAACNAAHEQAAKDDHDKKEAGIAKEATPANAATRRTLDGIATEIRKLRSSAGMAVPDSGTCPPASAQVVEDVNALR